MQHFAAMLRDYVRSGQDAVVEVSVRCAATPAKPWQARRQTSYSPNATTTLRLEVSVQKI